MTESIINTSAPYFVYFVIFPPSAGGDGFLPGLFILFYTSKLSIKIEFIVLETVLYQKHFYAEGSFLCKNENNVQSEGSGEKGYRKNISQNVQYCQKHSLLSFLSFYLTFTI